MVADLVRGRVFGNPEGGGRDEAWGWWPTWSVIEFLAISKVVVVVEFGGVVWL